MNTYMYVNMNMNMNINKPVLGLLRLILILSALTSALVVSTSAQTQSVYPGGGTIRVREADGSPNVLPVQQIVFPNGSLTRTGQTVTVAFSGGAGTGDVVGPASATDNAIVRFDGTGGKSIQNSVVTIADTTGVIAGTRGVTISGSTSGTIALSASATGGNLIAGNLTFTNPASGAVFALAGGKTFTVSNTTTIAGTDGSTLDIGGGGTLGSNAYTSTAYAAQATTISTTVPLGGGGDLSANRTLTCTTCTTNAAALTANLPVIGGGSNAVAVGTRSGNTTEFATSTGTKTTNKQLAWDANGNVVASASDIGAGSGANTALSNLASVAINTTLVSDIDDTDDLGSTSVRWKNLYLSGFMQWAGECYLAADATSTSATLANLSGCTISGLVSGRKYTFEAALFVSNSVAGEGVKIDFNGGTATSTNFIAHCEGLDTSLTINTQVAALNGTCSAATFTGNGIIRATGSFEPSGNGTFIVRFAENSASSGTLTVKRGSRLRFFDAP
jgi:hypothetical protein